MLTVWQLLQVMYQKGLIDMDAMYMLRHSILGEILNQTDNIYGCLLVQLMIPMLPVWQLFQVMYQKGLYTDAVPD